MLWHQILLNNIMLHILIRVNCVWGLIIFIYVYFLNNFMQFDCTNTFQREQTYIIPLLLNHVHRLNEDEPISQRVTHLWCCEFSQCSENCRKLMRQAAYPLIVAAQRISFGKPARMTISLTFPLPDVSRHEIWFFSFEYMNMNVCTDWT